MGDGQTINKILVVGLQGAGKTYAVKKAFIERDPYSFVIDVQKEYPEAPFRYIPKAADYKAISAEMEQVINRIIRPNCNVLENKKRYKEALNTVIFDEADAYFKAGQEMPHYAKRFFIDCRHLMLTNVISMSRRLMDINYYVRNTADYIVAFKQAGADDLNILNKFAKGAKEAMQNDIDYDKHNFLLFDRSRKYEICESWEDLTKIF